MKAAKEMIRTGLENAAKNMFKAMQPPKNPPISNPDYNHMMAAIGTLHLELFKALHPDMLDAAQEEDNDAIKTIEVPQVSGCKACM